MSIAGEAAYENDTIDFCKNLEEKIRKYPEAAKVLKEIGIECLDNHFQIYSEMIKAGIYKFPEWATRYYSLFRE